ncbi:Gfo/Idh/MocA family protein [Saccharibacillus sp. JS10]|uniref:Gfo/Idh/MocA family protein n=1 Tax=Saccharibacillus sp. JS10 TaxID=2950552 RepID=UPI00210CDEA7|nr:Gfo/Idh/MocA family oxidoreductase [Saccharibacillus sp. JS10]MCQ4086404.1 Gfo/Idh/MocA family oxidoreductase [Saccharibacillus sp. JS10]
MNIGTIGTGSIVEATLSAIERLEKVTCTAMYSRKKENAEMLANRYQVENIYTDLNSLFTDSNIDLIYIASPNSLHYEHAYQALQHGKHVVCEKPFTSTLQEAEQLIALAKEKNLFLFEGISNIHLPNLKIVHEQLDKLGPIKLIQCNYSQYSQRYNDLLAGHTPNVFNPRFSGGALMDINNYNLHLIVDLFGLPDSVSYTANLHPNGIDTSGVAILKYPQWIATCTGSKDTSGLNFVLIQGEQGYLHIVDGANGCKEVRLHFRQEPVQIFNAQTQDDRLYYEWEHFRDVYINNDVARCHELLEHSYRVMNVLTTARKDAGIVFAADQYRLRSIRIGNTAHIQHIEQIQCRDHG